MKKPSLPKTVLILGRLYQVIQQDQVYLDEKEVSGLCDTLNRCIYIEKGLPLKEKMGILAHEMAHAALDINGLAETMADKELEVVCQMCRSLVEDFIASFNKR